MIPAPFLPLADILLAAPLVLCAVKLLADGRREVGRVVIVDGVEVLWKD